MTRKDFELIADTIRNLDLDRPSNELVAKTFARELKATNARFDSARFIAACMTRTEVEPGTNRPVSR